MNVVVDTSIWSEVLRRRSRGSARHVRDIQELIDEGRVVMLGPIRQEILSGLKQPQQFEQLRSQLRAFPDHATDTEDFEHAASCFNRCRRKGVQGSNTDFLICAVALRNSFQVFTSDRDFDHYRKLLGIDLYRSRLPA